MGIFSNIQTVVRVEAEAQLDNLSNPLNLSFTIEEADKTGFVPDVIIYEYFTITI